MKERLCGCCGKDISHRVGNARYCDDRCKQWVARKYQDKNCWFCGEDIFLTFKHKYCDSNCRNGYFLKYKDERELAELKRRYTDRMYMMSLNSSEQAIIDIKRIMA